MDIAKSLAKRNGFSFDKSYGIWLNYNLSALKMLSDQQPIFISYDQLLDTPQQQLSRLAECLSIPYSSEDENFRSELTSFLSLELRHSRSDANDLKGAPQMVTDLYQLLMDVAKDKFRADTDFFYKITEMDVHFRKYTDLFRWDMEKYFRNENNLIPELKAKIDEIELTVSAGQQQIVEKDQRLIALEKTGIQTE